MYTPIGACMPKDTHTRTHEHTYQRLIWKLAIVVHLNLITPKLRHEDDKFEASLNHRVR